MKFPEVFQFVKSNKGQDKLVYENYVYTLQKQRETFRGWRCEKRTQCKARIDYDGKTGKIKKGRWEHTHEADPIRIETMKIKAEMKVLALIDKEADADAIFRKVTEKSSPEVVKKLSAEVCKRNINRFKTICTLTPKMLSSADSATGSLGNTEFISKSLENSQSLCEAEGAATEDDNQLVQIKVEPDTEDLEFINEQLPSFLKSQRGKKKLTWKGYVYNLDKKRPGKHFWKCEKRRICSGRVICSEGEVELSKMHTHPPDITRIKKLKIREKIRAEALSADDPKNSTKILENVMKEASSDISNLMSTEKMRNTIRYVRKKRLQNPSAAELTNCGEEKSDEEMQFRLPTAPQVPKGAAKKSKGVPPRARRGRSSNTSDKENQQSVHGEEDNVEIIENEVEGGEETEGTLNERSATDNLLSEKLRLRFQEDFEPKLKELRDTMLVQVGQMMLDFEENFFSYLLSVTEDSATLLTDRYKSKNNTMMSENEEVDDSEDDDGSDEEDENSIEDDEEDSENEDDHNSEDEDDDYENAHLINRSNAISKGKKRGKSLSNLTKITKSKEKPNTSITTKATRSSKMIILHSKSLDSLRPRKRKPLVPSPLDYDSTDEANLPQNRILLPKEKPGAIKKLSKSVSVTEAFSPQKRRKVSSITSKVPQPKRGNSGFSSRNSDAGDSLRTTTEDDHVDINILSPILLPEDIKLENSDTINISQESPRAVDSQTLQETMHSNILELSSIQGSS